MSDGHYFCGLQIDYPVIRSLWNEVVGSGVASDGKAGELKGE
jgi:hypothetical protein